MNKIPPHFINNTPIKIDEKPIAPFKLKKLNPYLFKRKSVHQISGKNAFQHIVHKIRFTKTRDIKNNKEIILESDGYWIKQGNSDYLNVQVNNIVFIEAKDKICEFHMLDRRIIESRATLQREIYDQTFSYYDNFYKLGRSYVINLTHVKNISGRRILYPELGKNRFIRIPDDQMKSLFNLLKIGF
jgi:DNA-binding LytR/AlgR family response regulator